MRYLCLFASARLRDTSCFSAGGWTEPGEGGAWEFHPHVVDPDSAALILAGLFDATTMLVDATESIDAAAFQSAGAALAAGSSPGEIVPARSPVDALRWLSETAPGLIGLVRPDESPAPASPAWWRARLSGLQHNGCAASINGADESDARPETLDEFLRKRSWGRNRAG